MAEESKTKVRVVSRDDKVFKDDDKVFSVATVACAYCSCVLHRPLQQVFETSKEVKVCIKFWLFFLFAQLNGLECAQAVASFDNMGLKEDLLRGIYAYGACHFQFHF